MPNAAPKSKGMPMVWPAITGDDAMSSVVKSNYSGKRASAENMPRNIAKAIHTEKYNVYKSFDLICAKEIMQVEIGSWIEFDRLLVT